VTEPEKHEPTFTVVMPAYNAARTVGSAIRSVLSQTRRDFELIVVDDGSADDTAARVRSLQADERVRLVRQPNGGPGSARNAGIARARARYVSFLDSDDLWLPSYLEVMGNCLEREPDVAFAYTDAWVLDDRTRRIRRTTAMSRARPPMPPPDDPEEFLALLLERNFIANSVTIRRAVLEEVGGYDPALQAAQDWELWLRIVARGHRAVRAPGLLFIWRDRADSVSSDPLSLARYRRQVYRLVAAEHGVPEPMRQRAHARMRECDAKARSLEKRRAAELRRRVRRPLGRVKRRVLRRRNWYPTPPPEVAAAFPDLRSV
jgi:glycosyltransferase involved in cell wall biosynthesis